MVLVVFWTTFLVLESAGGEGTAGTGTGMGIASATGISLSALALAVAVAKGGAEDASGMSSLTVILSIGVTGLGVAAFVYQRRCFH